MFVPRPEDLVAAVRPVAELPDAPAPPPATTGSGVEVSRETRALIAHAVMPRNTGLSLGDRFEALGIGSGSVRKRVLDEGRRFGLFSVVTVGRFKCLTLTAKAYELAGAPPPAGLGKGGARHQFVVARMARSFRACGCEVTVEAALGPARKRVDALVLLRDSRRVAVEVGLSSAVQEARNVLEDLANGAALVVLVSDQLHLLERVRASLADDGAIDMSRVRFATLEGLP